MYFTPRLRYQAKMMFLHEENHRHKLFCLLNKMHSEVDNVKVICCDNAGENKDLKSE